MGSSIFLQEQNTTSQALLPEWASKTHYSRLVCYACHYAHSINANNGKHNTISLYCVFSILLTLGY